VKARKGVLSDAEIRIAAKKLNKASGRVITFPVKNFDLLNEFIRRGRARVENGIVVLLDEPDKEV
jgi:chemotaxis receptor (MCP) glutamine deamidase CheD